MVVRELELDLDAFEGPFDLLLTLLLKEELEPADVDMAAIVVAFVERLAEREELDLEASGEFLVLIAALLELKARALFPEEEADLAELEPEEAAEELARRLEEYRRMKEAAAWLTERLAGERDRFFRLGPAPLAPKTERKLAPQEPESLAAVLRLLAQEPPNVSLAHMSLRFPPVSQFVERFRALLARRTRFDFEEAVDGLSRTEVAVASQPLTVAELVEAAADETERVETALGLLRERYSEGRSGIVLEQVAGGWAFRAAREAAEACGRLFERPVQGPLSQASLETLAIVAYLGPCTRPDVARIRGVSADSAVANLVERGLISEAGRDDGAGGAVRYPATPPFQRRVGLESLSELPRLDDLGGDVDEIRHRLVSVAEKRPA